MLTSALDLPTAGWTASCVVSEHFVLPPSVHKALSWPSEPYLPSRCLHGCPNHATRSICDGISRGCMTASHNLIPLHSHCAAPASCAGPWVLLSLPLMCLRLAVRCPTSHQQVGSAPNLLLASALRWKTAVLLVCNTPAHVHVAVQQAGSVVSCCLWCCMMVRCACLICSLLAQTGVGACPLHQQGRGRGPQQVSTPPTGDACV